MTTTLNNSVAVTTEDGTATFNLGGINQVSDLATAPEMAAGDLNQVLSFNATLSEIDISASTLESIFKFKTDSRDLSNNEAEFEADCTGFANWPDISFSTTNVASGNVNSHASYTDQQLQHDMVRHIAKEITGGFDGADIFSNEEQLRADVVSADNEFKTNIHTDLSNCTGKTSQDTGDNNMVGRLLDVLKSTNHGRERLLDQMNDPSDNTADGTATFSVPFVAGDKVKFTVAFSSNSRQVGNTLRDVSTRTYLVTLNVT